MNNGYSKINNVVTIYRDYTPLPAGRAGPPALRVCHTRVKHNQNMSHQVCHKNVIPVPSLRIHGAAVADGTLLKLDYFPKPMTARH